MKETDARWRFAAQLLGRGPSRTYAEEQWACVRRAPAEARRQLGRDIHHRLTAGAKLRRKAEKQAKKLLETVEELLATDDGHYLSVHAQLESARAASGADGGADAASTDAGVAEEAAAVPHAILKLLELTALAVNPWEHALSERDIAIDLLASLALDVDDIREIVGGSRDSIVERLDALRRRDLSVAPG